MELVGADEQALILALGQFRDGILGVETVLVGCPKEITPPRRRKLLMVRLVENEGWLLEGVSASPTGHATILDAVVYGVQQPLALSLTGNQLPELALLGVLLHRFC